jgi:hypothetical protein
MSRPDETTSVARFRSWGAARSSLIAVVRVRESRNVYEENWHFWDGGKTSEKSK